MGGERLTVEVHGASIFGREPSSFGSIGDDTLNRATSRGPYEDRACRATQALVHSNERIERRYPYSVDIRGEPGDGANADGVDGLPAIAITHHEKTFIGG